jgi:ferritin-like metal-binding protein YciE
MGFFLNEQLDSLEDLLLKHVRQLYDAEIRIAEALPEMARTSSAVPLKRIFVQDLDQSRQQIERLDQVFGRLKRAPERESCIAIKSLLQAADDTMDLRGDAEVRDAALIAAAQQIEHYEIASYGAARSFALRLGQAEAARLLQTSLEEEVATDNQLTEIAENLVNARAVH